jgi:hypothetical protein
VNLTPAELAAFAFVAFFAGYVVGWLRAPAARCRRRPPRGGSV